MLTILGLVFLVLLVYLFVRQIRKPTLSPYAMASLVFLLVCLAYIGAIVINVVLSLKGENPAIIPPSFPGSYLIFPVALGGTVVFGIMGAFQGFRSSDQYKKTSSLIILSLGITVALFIALFVLSLSGLS